MSGPKIKNLIILILALTVVFLLILVVPLRMSQSRAEQAQHAQIAELYAGYDVQLDSAALPTSVTLYTIELGAGGEQTAAAALLGGSAQLQADATRYAAAFTAPTGRCEFSRAGGFDAALDGGEAALEKQRAMWELLKATDPAVYRHLRRSLLGIATNLPGKLGRKLTISVYKITQKLYGFN